MSMTPDAIESTPADARPCLGCGYDLRGLGEEPRCPECGLLNIPQGYREEVWKLVDSGKWFFSGFFHPFKKRLPGWWWSLDRPGDVKRSWKAVARNAVITVFILAAGFLAIDLFKLEIRYHWYYYDPNSAQRASTDLGDDVLIMDSHREVLTFDEKDSESRSLAIKELTQKGIRTNISETHRVVVQPSVSILCSYGTHMFIAILLIWAFPAAVGFLTQVRKSLPAFAMPKRTIIAAANLESHQMIYNALLAVTIVALMTGLRFQNGLEVRWRYEEPLLIAAYAFFAIVSATRWIGPVRSDYTRQLIRIPIIIGATSAVPWAACPPVPVLAGKLPVALTETEPRH